MQEDVLELDVPIRRPPVEVRAWWTGFPEEYVAEDPTEQPHRIRTHARLEDRIEVTTYWRGLFGRELKARETLHLDEEDRWRADVHMMGYSIHDEFEARPDGNGGTVLRIRSSIVPVSSLAALLRPFVVERLKRRLERRFRTAARLCEAAG